jgi:penicillin-binding protein 2
MASFTNKTYNPLRLNIFRAVILLAFGGLIARVYQLQFIKGQEYTLLADDNRFDEVPISAPRGVIYDRNGVALARNVPSFNVTITPAFLPADEQAELAVLERLSGLISVPATGKVTAVDEFGRPVRSLLDVVREGEGIAPYRPVVVKSDLDRETAMIIMEDSANLPGVDIQVTPVREYPTGALTAHVVGYMGPIPPERQEELREQGFDPAVDRIGYDGVEFSLENILAGRPGRKIVEQDVAGLTVRTVGQPLLAEPGYSVRLTIDVELQQAAQDALQNMIDFQNNYWNRIITQRGVVIAMNPRTGEVLAMVSLPAYDNSRFARNIEYEYYLRVSQDPLRPLFNQAVSSLYPPGSIFKVVTATGALAEGIVTPEQEIFDPGKIELPNRYYPNDPGQAQTFVCWHEEGHGWLNMIGAIANSCDVYFYKIGGGYPEDGIPYPGLGIERLDYWMEEFGLAQFTGIELAGEIDGIIPSPAWKRRTWGENWSTGDTYNSAFGQGYVTATPLQMLLALNAVANDGVQMRPTLVREIIDSEGHVVRGFEPEVRHVLTNQDGTPVSQEIIDVVQEGMRQAVLIGTATTANLPYVPVAGKTGTAEYCDDEAAALDLCVPGNWPAHAWFMAYAPYENPEISVIAFIYNGNEGAIVALPVAMEVMDAYFRLKTERALAAQATQMPGAAPAEAPTSTPTLEVPVEEPTQSPAEPIVPRLYSAP